MDKTEGSADAFSVISTDIVSAIHTDAVPCVRQALHNYKSSIVNNADSYIIIRNRVLVKIKISYFYVCSVYFSYISVQDFRFAEFKKESSP